MRNGIQNIINYVQANGFVYDVETVNFFNKRRRDGGVDSSIFSASFARWGDRRPTTVYTQPSSDVIESMSHYSKGLYDRARAKNPFHSSTQQFESTFLNYIRNNNAIVGHNISYDIAHTFEALSPSGRLEMQRRFQGMDDPAIKAEIKRLRDSGKNGEAKALAKHYHRKISTGSYKITQGINAAYSDGGADAWSQPYKAFKSVTNEARNAGRIVPVDTMHLSQMLAGVAYERGLLKLKDHRAFGHKLEFLASALGRDTKEAHTEVDVLFNQPVLDAFGGGDLDRLMSRNFKGGVSDTTKRLLQMYETVDQAKFNIGGSNDFSHLNYLGELDKLAIAKEKTGNLVDWRTKHFSTRIAKQVTVGKAAEMIGGTYKKSTSEVLADLDKRTQWLTHRVDDTNNSIEKVSYNFHQKHLDDLKKKIIRQYHGVEDIREIGNFLPAYSTEGKAGAALSSSLKNIRWGKVGLYVGGAVAAATIYSTLRGGYSAPDVQTPDKSNHAFNPIEGLHPGGGVNKTNIQQNTDFGSPLTMKGGVSKAFDFVGDVVSGFAKSVRNNSGIIGAAAIPGLAYGYYEGKKKGGVNWKHLGASIAIDTIDDVAAVGIPILASRIPQLEKVGTFMKSHPSIEKGGMAFLGFTLGKTVGEIIASSRIPGKDDAYNIISGMRHQGVAGATRKHNTEFGSGYQGPNPDLEPAYNKAKDVYRYEQFRASGIGKSEEDIYKWMTEEDKETSEYVSASASAGTAMHALIQAQNYKAGVATGHEMLVSNKLHGISGHIDIERTDLGVGDIKTVNAGIFRQMVKAGKPKPQHYAQVQFYMAEKGQELGYIQYVNRDQPSQQKVYTVKFDPVYYENLIAKVERVRARVLTDIAAGRLSKNHLPKTASLERLEEDNEHVPSPQEMVQNLSQYQQTFREEMSYLRTVKRGMPTAGAGYERIQANNKRKNNSWAVSTQGIGLQSFADRSQHHRMQGYGV